MQIKEKAQLRLILAKTETFVPSKKVLQDLQITYGDKTNLLLKVLREYNISPCAWVDMFCGGCNEVYDDVSYDNLEKMIINTLGRKLYNQVESSKYIDIYVLAIWNVFTLQDLLKQLKNVSGVAINYYQNLIDNIKEFKAQSKFSNIV